MMRKLKRVMLIRKYEEGDDDKEDEEGDVDKEDKEYDEWSGR